MSLSIITLWLTAFPLQGFLLPEKSWFPWFLIFHLIGYTIIFLKFSWFEKFNFFPFFILKGALLTALFPFIIDSLKLYILIFLALFFPLIILRALSFLKKDGNSFFPYMGFILGNWITLILNFWPLSKVYVYLFIGINLFFLYFLNPNFKTFSKKEEDFLPFPLKNLVYLFLGISIFYFSGTLVYLWIEKSSYPSILSLGSLTLFYSLGVLLGILLKKKKIIFFKELFILGSVFLAFSKAFFHFENEKVLFIAQFFIFSSSGLMDFITLYFFINNFTTIRFLSLLYALINLSLLLGHLLFHYLVFYQKEHILSFLTLVALLTFVFFYKTEIKEKEEKILTEKKEEKLTPEILQIKLNKSLNSSAKKLTLRESEVLFYHLIQNTSLKEVAQILGISRSSVREYLKRAAIKLGCSVYELKDKVTEKLNPF
ncbi:MAG: hypothetical protein NZ530_01115 [Thermodesulfobacteriaceae bacterium]|nr:hypothetical protein [Thermodesulfobacteriaceae bacterium]MCX8042286.1 hypothetical protein [Thermodesulfobacteriaceae bacterium]MDW8136626.1 sigma factor-like helix-turn-helix DNA-binding protein [Thermodesulfobacterium sp.]